MNYQSLISAISPLYSHEEAKAMIRILLEDAFNISHIDACLGALDSLSQENKDRLYNYISRLSSGEPIQYILGKTEFLGNEFHIEPGVLIPRPETEELVSWIEEKAPYIKGDRNGNKYILDIGCGSGCISVSLALRLPSCDVSAWDISDTALRVTKQNARSLSARVNIYMQDALNPPSNDREIWDIIVSNPPYICNKEAENMHSNVLNHEPHVALFVPDNAPLLFYSAIAEYGTHALRKGGYLFFEINERYGEECINLVKSLGYTNATLRKDQFGRPRFISACK